MSEETAAKGQALTKAWMKKISDALAREKDYRTKAQGIVAIYEGKKPDQTPFAILYSNVEVLQPALYNQRPIPVVQRRFKDEDPLGKAVAEVSTRTLKFLIDTEDSNYENFDALMQPAVLDGCLTNRGLTRFKYVPHDSYECVYGEAVKWDKFFHGYARTWKKVPWIGFEWDMSKEELKQNFPEAKIDHKMIQTSEEQAKNTTESRQELTGVQTYKVYEIWDKATRKVYFFSACCQEPLKIAEDPFGLTNFFPVPMPLNFTKKTSTLIPTPLYTYYQEQAAELNELTRRLNAIIRAIKYRGAYNSTVEGLDKMLTAEDNDLVPVENISAMPDGAQGIDKLLYIVPVNELVQTAQTLYQAREACKQVIYEITGISDILRGASVASETATAQNIKNQWGSLRLKKMQREVQRYCRDALVIMLEIAAKTFEPKTFAAMTGLPFPMAEEKAQAQQAAALVQQQMQMAQATGQEPPQIPPEMQEKAEKILSSPSWEEILQAMQNNVVREYKTDIETNSTIDAEAAQDKQDIAELMNGIAQFLNGVAPLVQQKVLPVEVAKGMLLTVARRYTFGSEIEEAIMNMAEPQPEADPAAEAKAEQAKVEAQVKAQEAQQRMAMIDKETQAKLTIMDKEFQIAQQELLLKERELQLKAEEMDRKAAFAAQQHRFKMQSMAAQMAAKSAEPKEEATSEQE